MMLLKTLRRRKHRPIRTRERSRNRAFVGYSDERLVNMARRGEHEGFDELVARHQLSARRKAFAIIRDHQAAEDIVQEAFIKAYRRLNALKEPRKFSSWLLRTVQHTALDHRRARKEPVSLEVIREGGFEPRLDSETCRVTTRLEDQEDDLRVLEVVGRLRSDYREIFELKHLQHRTYRQIADSLGMTVSAVGEKLSRVRQMIKRRLEPDLAELDSTTPVLVAQEAGAPHQVS